MLGRNFLNGILKGWLPATLRDEFFAESGQTYDDIIQRVYRQPLANRYLATIVPFIHQRIDEPSLRQLVADNFEAFFRYNVLRYATPLRRMACVGGSGKPPRLRVGARDAKSDRRPDDVSSTVEPTVRHHGHHHGVRLQFQAAHLGVLHPLDLVHGLACIDRLNGLVDNAMTHGEHRLVGVLRTNPVQELLCSGLQVGEWFDVVWPFFDRLQVRDVFASERAPVSLTQQRCLHDGLMVRLSDDLASLYRTVEITGDEGVDVLSGHLVADAFRLGNARLVELSLHLALH